MKSRNDSLRLLQKIVRLKTRDKRDAKCLKNPERSHEDKDEWFMYVPSCFNDCLDITKTDRVVQKIKRKEWTQGSRFAFHRGCILYDTPKAYNKWRKAIKEIKYCISVQNGTSAEPAMNEKERNPGNVEFSIFSPSIKTMSLKEIGSYTLTQDEFISFLIKGNSDIIS